MSENAVEKPSLATRLFVALIFLFIGPVLWLAQKFNGGGCGAGPALASFMMASVVVLSAAGALAVGLIALVAYLVT